ncbi:Crp/Fnr family transcriptional regulator (plasmid) [Burkholderia cenocepacia]|uniref:Crp/Fnr family transcriptional regulator n=1 Tax=Burkholderia cenocepacia TaxID=95486 RepID=UPI00209E296B|nr:Crp/Fnr family transcriptional regulator [Burkholderia cenocepacia]MCO8402773.1 Crp/Fnr family transcriptional regulator [Burkholderia cenocepacia]MCO8415109.1 Crp/Fnr family transcriptional regulator [Burkholderia cenocepacia]MCO8423092.1 Crp/Fnr family transcriptional regulator [Burkholderia cenocepacia]MCO8474759.1 Crp/Fnr family transcriptional regulator [Burkholderia cenocepacia]MCO8482061.1 Crp/Fnr family transcriptional regulator [Burkholderia cenocepacia]
MDFPFAAPMPPDDDQAGGMPPPVGGTGDAYYAAKLEAAAARARARAATHPERTWPDDLPRPAPQNAPWILREMKLRLKRYFTNPAAWLPQLNVANGSARQQRSERREACVQLLRALLKYCDLRTLRIGLPGKEGWIDFTFNYLAEQAGLPLRRAERALKDLKRARLVTVRRQCELQETEHELRYKGIAAITYLAPAVFESFGLGRRLRLERNRAHLRAARRANRERKHDRKAAALATSLVDKIAEMASRSRSRNGAGQPSAVDREIEITRRAGQLKVDHPDWDRDTCFRIARQQLAPPG